MQNSSNDKPKIWPRIEAFPTGFTLLILLLGIYATIKSWVVALSGVVEQW
jgi:hypothetical protein